jgi:2-methylisocitrate lyase-like PEP mutase family enzyme
MTDFSRRHVALRTLLSRDKTVLIPGCFDCLSAKLVEDAGFPVVYIGSYATAASRLGLPDSGLVSLSEMVAHAQSIVNCVGIPVIADAENGFHNAANIWQTIRAFENAGVSGIHIEDHEFGKHTDVEPVLLPVEQMVQKIHAAVDAREDDSFVIIARTDAFWAWKDADEVVKRLNAYTAAGADLVFPAGMPVHALRPVRARVKGKVVITNRPGASIHDEQEAGANAVLYYGLSLHAAYHAIQGVLSRLKQTGDANTLTDALANVDEFERFIGYPAFVEKAKRYGLTT